MKKTSSKNFLNGDFLFLCLCLVFFVVVFIDTFTMKNPTTYRLPRLLSGFGILTTIAIFIFNSGKILIKAAEVKAHRQKGEGVHALLVIIFVAAYFFLTTILGFILTSFLAVIGLAYMMKYEKKVLAFAAAVVFPVSLYLVFNLLLRVSLPSGPIEALFH